MTDLPVQRLGEPRIFIEVIREIGGEFIRCRKEISLFEVTQSRHAEWIAIYTINAALAEVGFIR